MKSLFRLSQAHLNLLEICPPQFQKIYLEQLILPTNPNQEEKKEWGNLFHLLMQQKELNLPVELLLKENIELKNSLETLIEKSSEILNYQEIINRQAEHYLSLNYHDYLLTVIYDLLITYKNQAIIFDWKTYALTKKVNEKLEKNWQTKLYLYVLAETSNYKPEDISITYWFIQSPNQIQHYTIKYNSKKHKQTQQDLNKILVKLNQWLDDYINSNINFPHQSNCEKKSPYYQFLLPFKMSNSNQQNINLLTNIDDIEEVSIN